MRSAHDGAVCSHLADGGARGLAHQDVDLVERGESRFTPLYTEEISLWDRVKAIATQLYDADDITTDKKVFDRFKTFEDVGFGHFPVGSAQTQYGFRASPKVPVRPPLIRPGSGKIRLSAGVEFVVVGCGESMTMPELPNKPVAEAVGVNERSETFGLA